MRRRPLVALAGVAAALVLGGAALGVPYLPTPPEVVHAMLEVAHVGPDDQVMDLGSGDGRIVIAAARDFGARAVGIERDEVLLARSREDALRAGVADRTSFRREDLYATDLRGVSVLTMYLLPSVNLGLRMRILEQMAPGTRVVSHAFDMGDWRPDAQLEVASSKIFLWVVPARVDGEWLLTIAGRTPDAAKRTLRVDVRQHFQQLSVRLAEPDAAAPGVPATLEGDALRFALPGAGENGRTATFRGRVLGDLISGRLDGHFATLRRVGPARQTRRG